jgi:hypothetical protein
MKIRSIVIGVIATGACAVAALAPASASTAGCHPGEVCVYDKADRKPKPEGRMLRWAGSRTDIIHFGNSKFRDVASSWMNRSHYTWCVYDVSGNRHTLLWRMNPGRNPKNPIRYDNYVGSSLNDKADYARRGTC